MVDDPSSVLPDFVWRRRECFAAQKRGIMPWTKFRKLDFAHSITPLIHPLPTLRRRKNEVDDGDTAIYTLPMAMPTIYGELLRPLEIPPVLSLRDTVPQTRHLQPGFWVCRATTGFIFTRI
jgi:hypothetical protein